VALQLLVWIGERSTIDTRFFKERKKQETLVLSCKVLLIERYTPAPTYNEPTSDEDVERRNPRRRRREK
jgi:hypothetical protein